MGGINIEAPQPLIPKVLGSLNFTKNVKIEIDFIEIQNLW